MGAVDTTYTFTATDTITSSKMNNIINQTTITGDAIFENTLEVVSGKLKVRAQGIRSNELATDAVTSTKIKSGSVDPTKLSTGYPSWTTSGNLTVNGSSTALSSVSVGTASVSIGSARTASGASNIDFNSTFPLTAYEARISRESGANGNLVISNTGTGSIVFNSTPLGAITGTAPIYGARAWANFDATKNSSGGTDALLTARFLNENSSSNVTSVTKTASGKYTVDFAIDMPDANYAVISGMSVSNDGSDSYQRSPKIYDKTVGGFKIAFWSGGSGSSETNPVSGTFAVFA